MKKINSPLICTVANNEYLIHLEKLIASIALNAPTTTVYIVLVNIPSEKSQYLKTIHRHLIFEFDYVKFESDEVMRGYCTNRRARLFYEQMRKFNQPFLWMDADTLLMNNPNELFEKIAKYDLSIIIDSSHPTFRMSDNELKKSPKGPLDSPYFGVVSAGVFGTNNSAQARQLFIDMYQLVSKAPYSWFADQEGLYLAFLKNKSKINFYQIEDKYAALENLDSTILFAKGHEKVGLYHAIGENMMWRKFDWKVNHVIDYSLTQNYSVSNQISFAKRAVLKSSRLLKYVKNFINRKLWEDTNLKNENIHTLIRRLDWWFAKHFFKKSLIRRRVLNFMMYLDTQTPGISRTIAINRIREEDMTSIIIEILEPGMTVLDCGSNIGYYPLLEAGCVGKTGKVICIEPDSRNINVLKKNVTRSEHSNIFSVHHMAISNKVGEAVLNVTKHSNLNKIIQKDDSAYSSLEKEVVPTNTVDNFLKENDLNIDFLRMDIEGHEVEVFEGMEETMKRANSGFKIFFELHPNEYNEKHSLNYELEKLFSFGFYSKIIVSAGEAQPYRFMKLGYKPDKTIKSDGFTRGIYYDVDQDDVSTLVCDNPKAARYLLLEKK
jgi:FkbM family methyltransferase